MIQSSGKFANYVVPAPPAESTILLAFLDGASPYSMGFYKSTDSGANFVVDASVPTIGYTITAVANDPSVGKLLCGTGDGYVYTYNNGVFDSSTYITTTISDIQVRGNIRVAGNGTGGNVIPF